MTFIRRRRHVGGLLLLFLILTPALPGQSQSTEFSVELFFGSAWSLPLPIRIDFLSEQTRFIAHYRTRPFADAPYYSYRLGRASDGRALEFEMLHHKLYLQNPQPPVERFEVSHGFNQPMINVAMPTQGWRWRFGIGFVVAHPEGRVGGRDVGPVRTALGGGYHVAGVSTQLAFGNRYILGHGNTALTAAPEAKLTAAVARIRINGGSVWIPNLAVHTLGGVGVRRRFR